MNINTRFKVFFLLAVLCVLLVSLLASPFFLEVEKKEKKKGPCDGRQWSSSREELKCRYPDPPIGRWHAVYTKEFAKSYNLPLENISNDLSPGVDYMEMDVQPYAGHRVACLVNMLVKRPNDIAFYSGNRKYSWAGELHKRRKLSQLLDLDEHKNKLKQINTFGGAPRDGKYDSKKSYTIGSSFGFYVESVLAEYDYITADAGCYYILSDASKFPNGWAFNYAKASIWGRYERKYISMNQRGRPKGKDFFDSRVFINIPSELVSNVFKDMPIGGRR